MCPGGCALGVEPGAQHQRAATHDLVAPANESTPANEWLGRKVVVTGLAASNMLNGRTGMCIFININYLYNIYINIYLYDLLRATAATGAQARLQVLMSTDATLLHSILRLGESSKPFWSLSTPPTSKRWLRLPR